MCGLLGSYYFLSFPYGLGIDLSRSSHLSSPLVFHFCCSSSCHAHELADCHSYHVGPLDSLPPLLGFPNPFTSPLPLIVLMGPLTVIPATLAYWVYYLFAWVSSAYLLHFYLLLCPWACWLSFLSRWPIGFIISFIGLPRPIYFTFTSYCFHGPTVCHFCHVDPLGLLSYFYHLYCFFLSFSLLLGFFCH